MQIENLRDLYSDAAKRHGRALEEGDSDEANAAFAEKEKLLKKLRSMPDRGREFLTDMLFHDDPGVRKSAATHMLPIDQASGLAELERIAKLPGLVGFDAEMVIREWKAGRLRVL